MANIFSTIARKETSLSPLMDGRNRLSMDEVIANYPQGVTVNAFDFIGSGEDAYPVFTFAEDAQKFAFGGTVFAGVARAWADMYDGDIEKASSELKSAGGVKMVFAKSRTKNGNTVTTVNVID